MSTPINTIGRVGGNTAVGDDQLLGQSFTFWIPPDGSTIDCRGYWGASRSFFVQNFSTTQSLRVVLDGQYTLTIPIGNRELISIPFGDAKVHFLGISDVAAAITLFSDLQDTQNAIRNMTILGNVNAIVSGNISIVGSSVTLSTQDTVVETNTTFSRGLLPQNSQVFTLGPGASNSYSVNIISAISGFSLEIQSVDGFLSLYYTIGGNSQFIFHRIPFNGDMNNAWDEIEQVFDSPIPTGSTLTVQLEYSSGTMSGTLKW